MSFGHSLDGICRLLVESTDVVYDEARSLSVVQGSVAMRPSPERLLPS